MQDKLCALYWDIEGPVLSCPGLTLSLILYQNLPPTWESGNTEQTHSLHALCSFSSLGLSPCGSSCLECPYSHWPSPANSCLFSHLPAYVSTSPESYMLFLWTGLGVDFCNFIIHSQVTIFLPVSFVFLSLPARYLYSFQSHLALKSDEQIFVIMRDFPSLY